MVLRGSKGWTRYGKGRGRDLEPLEEGFELGVVVGSGGCHGSVRVRRIARERWRELQKEKIEGPDYDQALGLTDGPD